MKFLLTCFYCLLPAVLLARQTPDQQKNPFAGDPRAIAAGKKLFDQTCQACHGADARGDRGPALAGGKLQEGNEDEQVFSNIRNGIKGTQMPPFPNLSADNVWQIITYIRSLGEAASRPNERVAGDTQAGESLFFGKAHCDSCHQVNEKGVAVGPDLSEIGRNSAQSLHDVIVDPDTAGRHDPARMFRRGPRAVSIKMPDGREIQGMRLSEDTYSLVLRDLQGKLHFIDKQNAEERSPSHSLMPAYGTQLSTSEINNLVAYLKGQQERDFSKTVQVSLGGNPTFDRLRNSEKEPQNWLTYWGNYAGEHFSRLKQVTGANVTRLQARWAAQMPGDSILESTPVVVDRIMYTSGPPGEVYALDAKTGLQIWKFQRKQKVVSPYEINPFNRGVAVENGRVFVGTLDAALIALDASTGLPVWETQIADTMQGYTVTGAPLAVNGKVIVGVSGGEFGAPGFLDAYDAATGKRLWRFHTIPEPGEYGHDTWKDDSWKHGGGPTWLTGSYDPQTDTVYWGVGNPSPDLNPAVRSGDNLFSCSVIALDASTGKRKWHYQFTPNDSHDWDAAEDLVLANRVINGEQRALVMQADRNGFFYVLDRQNGQFVLAKPFVRQTWNQGFDKDGHPIVDPNSKATPAGSFVYPALGGGSNWQSPSYDPETHMLYVVSHDSGMEYSSGDEKFEPGRVYMGRGRGSGKRSSAGDAVTNSIRAIDTGTGNLKWEYKVSQGSLAAGVLGTSGGVLFAATSEGNLIALDAGTGKHLWHFQTGAVIASSPMSYAVDGEQFVALAAGNVLYTFALPK